MNALEKIGIEKLREHLSSALVRCDEKNHDRMQNERIFLEGDLKRAFEVIRALEENSEQHKKQ